MRAASGAFAFGGQKLRGKPEMQQESRRRRMPGRGTPGNQFPGSSNKAG